MKKIGISANHITALRIIGTVSLLFISIKTSVFYIIYAVTGFTDILDGYVARKTNTVSNFGAKLDSVSDLLFYSVMFIKFFPLLLRSLPKFIWIIASLAVFIRLLSYLAAALKFKRFSSMHTYLNKITGFCVFLIPFAMLFKFKVYYFVFASLMGLAASAEELIIHLRTMEYKTDIKSLLALRKA